MDSKKMSLGGRIYAYCRVSSQKQNIERQMRNILTVYPTAIIVKEFKVLQFQDCGAFLLNLINCL